MPSKEQYYISWLAKHIVRNIKAWKNTTSIGESLTLKASTRTTKSAIGIWNSSSKIWLQDTFKRYWEILFSVSEVTRCNSLETHTSSGCSIFRDPETIHAMKSPGGRKHRRLERMSHHPTTGLSWTAAIACHQLYPHWLLKWKLSQISGKSAVVW